MAPPVPNEFSSQRQQQDQRWGALMCAAQAGDADSFRTLLIEISPLLRNFCNRRAGHLISVEDVVQECLLMIHRKRHVYDPTRSFTAWVVAITRNRLIDHIRSAARRRRNEVLEDTSVTESGGGAYQEGHAAPRLLASGAGEGPAEFQFEDRVLVRTALAKLGDPYREAITLTRIEDLSTEDAARRMGITESSLRVRTHRAIKMLRGMIRKEYVE